MSKQLKVWCEISCSYCGVMDGGYYHKGIIGRLRKSCKGWKQLGGDTICPQCYEEMKRRKAGLEDD